MKFLKEKVLLKDSIIVKVTALKQEDFKEYLKLFKF